MYLRRLILGCKCKHSVNLICCQQAALIFLFPLSLSDDANPSPLQDDPQFQLFKELSSVGNLIPVYQRVMADQLTPVVAYRCLVNEHDEDTPSFLLESVINGDKQGRYSFVGTQPIMEILAEGNRVTVLNHQKGTRTVSEEVDPMEVSRH